LPRDGAAVRGQRCERCEVVATQAADRDTGGKADGPPARKARIKAVCAFLKAGRLPGEIREPLPPLVDTARKERRLREAKGKKQPAKITIETRHSSPPNSRQNRRCRLARRTWMKSPKGSPEAETKAPALRCHPSRPALR
jgi:hypothetical protein